MMVALPTSFTQPITKTVNENGTENSNPAIIEKKKPVITTTEVLSAKAYPNPHQGAFSLQITSPETGIAKIEMFSVNGQKLQEKTVALQKGENNVVPVNLTQYGTAFYRVQIGKYIANGKVIGAN
jgi:hypothetical protein